MLCWFFGEKRVFLLILTLFASLEKSTLNYFQVPREKEKRLTNNNGYEDGESPGKNDRQHCQLCKVLIALRENYYHVQAKYLLLYFFSFTFSYHHVLFPVCWGEFFYTCICVLERGRPISNWKKRNQLAKHAGLQKIN